MSEYMRELVREYRALNASVDPIRAKLVAMWTEKDRETFRVARHQREMIAFMLMGAIGRVLDSYDAEQTKQSVA